jgi:hypothetical protein
VVFGGRVVAALGAGRAVGAELVTVATGGVDGTEVATGVEVAEGAEVADGVDRDGEVTPGSTAVLVVGFGAVVAMRGRVAVAVVVLTFDFVGLVGSVRGWVVTGLEMPTGFVVTTGTTFVVGADRRTVVVGPAVPEGAGVVATRDPILVLVAAAAAEVVAFVCVLGRRRPASVTLCRLS